MPEIETENLTEDKIKEIILGYIILKTERSIDQFLELMLCDSQFVSMATSIGLDVEKELLKILQDRLTFKLSQKGDTHG
jgi:hypothetical protein